MTIQVSNAYIWRVVYQDETVVCEEHVDNFASIDASRVASLFLLPLAGGASHRVDIPKGAQPVFFRRRSITVNPLQGAEQGRTTTHCIGWKRGDDASYLFIHEDGSTLLSSDLQAA